MTDIDGDRLLRDLRTLAGFGQYRTGVDRVAFSQADIAARRWLAGRMAEAGLQAGLDRYGTVLGRAPEVSQSVLVGSHSDSVPKGGWLDGALGVVYGLEVARSLRSAGLPGVDVVSFQDEEGSYHPCLGAKSFCGTLDPDVDTTAKEAGGQSLADAMAATDLDPTAPPFRLDPARHIAFFEAHIEQGPRLEQAGVPVAVANGIVGIRRFQVKATGQADHAGTTPMALRRDAGAGLIAAAHGVLAAFRAAAQTETVWNIGAMAFRPGAPNVVPAEAEMTVEFRDIDPATLGRLETALRDTIDRTDAPGVGFTLTDLGRVEAMRFDAGLGRLIHSAARARGIEALEFASGAGHDAMVLGRHVPAALMFVPSIGGRSHDITENTRPEDIVAGCQVLADAVRARLGEAA